MASRDPKRARKKEARDARLAAHEAQRRRRRLAWTAGIGAFALVLGALVVNSLAERGRDEAAAPGRKEGRRDPNSCPSPDDVPAARPRQYDAPERVLQQGVDYAAVVRTSCGDIEMDLLEDEAPKNVNSFLFLAREGFYDGLTFHRVERNFVIQAGDPNGQNGEPPDGPGYALPDELPEAPSEYVFGVVGMANSGPNSGGSQFFIITNGPPEDGASKPVGLPRQYTIFAEVAPESYEAIEQIDAQKTKGGGGTAEAAEPVEPIYILGIDILRH